MTVYILYSKYVFFVSKKKYHHLMLNKDDEMMTKIDLIPILFVY